MKHFLFTTIMLLGLSSFAVELKFGSNHIHCENTQIGQFDIDLTVNDVVTSTEYYKEDKTTPPVPSWEHLESQLTQLYFTSGSLLIPSDRKVEIKDAELTVLRNVFRNPENKEINFSLKFPKETFVTEALLVDHTHPEQYKTSELGGQTFLFIGESFVQTFFRCR